MADSAGVAYSFLKLSKVDADLRVLEGFASTPLPDRDGDVVDPKGLTFKNPLPLLLHHDVRLPVGYVSFKSPTSDGVPFVAHIPHVAEPGVIKDRTDEAFHSAKYGLITGASIRFLAKKDALTLNKHGGFDIAKAEVIEMSMVTIPCNPSAGISSVKSLFDPTESAASGHSSSVQQAGRPRDRGAVVRTAKKDAPTTMKKTIQEQIAAFEQTRETKQARMTEIMQKASEENVTLDVAEQEEYDGLKIDAQNITEHIKRLVELEEVQKTTARPVAAETMAQASASRGGNAVISIKSNRPPGVGMARVAIAKYLALRYGATVKEIAAERWPDDTDVKAYFQKATVPAGLTTDATWAGNLVDTTNLSNEFIEFLRPQTIIGRIPGLTRVPFNVRVTGQTTGSVANWVGQGKPKPVTSFGTNAQTLLFAKIAAIAVITDELARFSSPSAEALVRNELARAVIERMDVDFIDPATAAVANVSPASVTYGVTPLSSAGTSADNIRTDIQNLLESFILNNVNPTGLVIVMPNTLALAASILRNSLGQPEFPELTMTGGTLMGIPVITSQYAANQSGSGNLVIALNAPDIFLADDGQVTLDASREASIQMSDAPSNDASTGTGQSLVSMFQTNSIAIRAERFINWAKMRTTAVSFIDDVNWGSIGSPS